MKKKRLFIPILCLFFLLTNGGLQAQGEGDYWFFGQNGGLHFVGNTPTTVSGGALSTNEGCATISDAAGNLLFYTDGISVWNKQHDAMPNGFGLLGDPSASQSGIIVPLPNNPNRYYIFTVPATPWMSIGLNYSIVDMSLQGGLGDVLFDAKNVPVVQPVTEKISAVRHANGIDYWVITHLWESDAFHAYLLSAGGLSSTPVVSNVGSVHTGGDNNVIGYLKCSANGKKIASNITFDHRGEMFDFDSGTGAVSNPFPYDFDAFTDEGPYGLEFSPDNTKLYIGIYNHAKAFQFDVTAPTPDAFLASKTLAFTAPSSSFVGALQLAKDQKIYASLATTNFIGRIESPNSAGAACNYVDAFLSLPDFAQCSFGFPTFIQSYFDVCANSSVRFFSVFKKSYVCPDCSDGRIAVAGIGGTKPYTYAIDGGPNPGVFQPSGVFNNLPPGIYVVTIKDGNGCTIKRTIKIG